MSRTNDSQIENAIAYLKINLSDDEKYVVLEEKDEPVLLEMDEDCLMAFLVDKGDTFSYIQRRVIDSNNMTEEEIAQIGVDNLRKLANEHLQVNENKGVYSVSLDGNFEASFV